MFDSKKYFTKARRDFIEEPLKDLGFRPYKTSSIGRLTSENVFQFLNFQKSAYGAQQFTINVAIRPMFCRNDDFLILTPGNRLGHIYSGKDTWWEYSSEETGHRSFKEIFSLIQKCALPFFESTTSCIDIIKSYEKNLFGYSKFGNAIHWGPNDDIGHTYLQSQNNKKALKHFRLHYDESKKIASEDATSKYNEIEMTINSGQTSINNYLMATALASRRNLGLMEW